MPRIELRTLGDCVVAAGDQRIGPQAPHAFALLVYLGFARGRVVPREELLPLIFPGTATRAALHNLRQLVYSLRNVYGIALETEPGGIVLPPDEVHADFAELLATGVLPPVEGDRLPGEFLPGYWPKLSDEYARWLDAQRDTVNSALRRAYVTKIVDRRKVGRWDQVEQYARACLVVDPLNEEATLALAEALALTGAKVAALRLLDQYELDVGDRRLALPAKVLKRRISEVPARAEYRQHAMVGREAEIEVLNTALADALHGVCTIVSVEGEPGVGKSRLLKEFLVSAKLRGTYVVEELCHPYNARQRLGAIGRLLPALLSAPGALGISPEALAALRQIVPEGRRSFAPPHADLSEGLVVEVCSLFAELTDAVSTEQCLVIALDDAQWVDSDSAAVLAGIGARSRCIVVLAGNSLPPVARTRSPRLKRLGIGALEKAAAVALTCDELAANGISTCAELLGAAWDATRGNPYHIVVWAGHYAQSRDIARAHAQIERLLAERLAAMDMDAQSVLLWCALLEQFATVERLCQLSGFSPQQLLNVTRSCEHSGFLRYVAGALRVAHRLVADAIIGLQPPGAIRLARHSVASVLCANLPDRSGEDLLWAAAGHLELAGDTEGAIARLTDIARRVGRRGGLLGMISALGEVRRLGEPRTADALYMSIRHELRADYGAWDEPARSAPLISGPDRVDATYAADATLLQMDVRALVTGYTAGDVDLVRRILTDTTASDSLRLRAASVLVAQAEHTCTPDVALRNHDTAEKLLPMADSSDPTAVRYRLSFDCRFGDPQAALMLATKICRSGQQESMTHVRLAELSNAALVLVEWGKVDQAVAAFGDAVTLALHLNMPAAAKFFAVQSAYQLDRFGRREAAVDWWKRATAFDSSASSAARHAYLYAGAVMAMNAGHLRVASQFVDQLPRPTLLSQNSVVWALTASAYIRLEAERGTAPTPRSLDALKRWSLGYAALRPEDDVALAVYLGLVASKQKSDANRFINCYLTKRSYPDGISASLRSFTS